MKTSNEIKNLLCEHINNIGFDVNYTTMSNTAYVDKKIGGYHLEFVVYYDQREKNYRDADYFQPSETDVEYLPNGIEDVCVYINNEICEINEQDLETIKNNLYSKIIDKK